jgi:hypothetical protein
VDNPVIVLKHTRHQMPELLDWRDENYMARGGLEKRSEIFSVSKVSEESQLESKNAGQAQLGESLSHTFKVGLSRRRIFCEMSIVGIYCRALRSPWSPCFRKRLPFSREEIVSHSRLHATGLSYRNDHAAVESITWPVSILLYTP